LQENDNKVDNICIFYSLAYRWLQRLRHFISPSG